MSWNLCGAVSWGMNYTMSWCMNWGLSDGMSGDWCDIINWSMIKIMNG